MKSKSGYTNDNGLHKTLLEIFHSLCFHKLEEHFCNSLVEVNAVTDASDGTALNPFIQFDPLYKVNASLIREMHLKFVKEHTDVEGETLKDFVSEAVVTFCTVISNPIYLPAGVDYMTKSNYKWLNEMPAPKMTLDINNIKCNIYCATVGHTV